MACEIYFQLDRLWFHDFAHLDFGTGLWWEMSLAICLPGQSVCSWSVKSPVLAELSPACPALCSVCSTRARLHSWSWPWISELRNHLNINVNDKVMFVKFKECKRIGKKKLQGYLYCVFWGANNIFTCWKHCVHRLLSTPSATLHQWAAFLARHFGRGSSPSGNLPREEPVEENRTLSQDFFQHSHHRRRVYKGGKSHAHFPFVYRCVTAKSSYFPTRITRCHRTSLILMALAVWFQKKNPLAVWNAQLLGTRVGKHPACRER